MPTRLRLQPRQLTLEAGPEDRVTLPVGAQALAQACFRHDPPSPAELEHAIDAVEDALAAAGLMHAERGGLATSDALLRSLPGLGSDGASLSRDEVEALFQRLASASLGHPAAAAGLPRGGVPAASLLLLRELMHHLGFDAITALAPTPAATQAPAGE